jgi:hypothetical protein
MKTKLAALAFATSLSMPAFAHAHPIPVTLYNDAEDQNCNVDPVRCWNAGIFQLTAQTLRDALPQFEKDWHERRYRVFTDGKHRRGYRIYFTDNPSLCGGDVVGYNVVGTGCNYAVVCVAENFAEQQYPVSQIATHEAFELLSGKQICDPVNDQTHIDPTTGQTVADYELPGSTS